MKSTQALKMLLNQKLASMHDFNILNDSNYKFMVLLQTRLMEAGIPLETATLIASVADYDLSFVNEDDDYIGDVACTYAEFCVKMYNRLKAVNFHRQLNQATVYRFFNPLGRIAP
jgi:hypothetical protein